MSLFYTLSTLNYYNLVIFLRMLKKKTIVKTARL